MEQLGPLDAQFLNLESATTTGHVGSLIVLDPATAPGGSLTLGSVRAVLEARVHLAPVLRRRLVEVPLGLTRPYWVDDPDFDIEFHLREVALPTPGEDEQLAEQVARIHARPLDRARPLWEAYVITGLEGGRAALYWKIHHSVTDGASGSQILETLLDTTVEPREVQPEGEPFAPRPLPTTAWLLQHGLAAAATSPVEVAASVPRTLPYLASLPGARNIPGTRLLTGAAETVGRVLGRWPVPGRDGPRPPRTPLNGAVTAHRRFSFGSVPLTRVERVKDHFAMTVDDVVMVLAASALRRWLLDHDALPRTPLVVAIPVWVRPGRQRDNRDQQDQQGERGERGEQGERGEYDNQVSVITAQLPTHLADARERLEFMRDTMTEAKQQLDAVPASVLAGISSPDSMGPTALSGSAARALFRLAIVPGPSFNLFVSNVPGPQVPLYVAGARVAGIYPVSAVTDRTGALNIAVFSYDGDLDFGLVVCRELVPDVWNLVCYLREATDELLALVGEG